MQYIKNKRLGKKHVSYSYKTNTKNAGNKRQWSEGGKRYIPRIPVYSLYAYKKKHSYSTTGHNATQLSCNLNTV